MEELFHNCRYWRYWLQNSFFKEGVQQMQIASLNLNVQLTDLNLLCSTLQLGASHSSRTDLGFIWIFYITRIPNRDTESTEKAFE